jgi:hypothetical protein
MSFERGTLCVFALACAVALASVPARAGSEEAREVARWVMDNGDNRGAPFAIVDKKRAQILVFDPAGRLLGATPALLGQAPGDHSVPGVGEKDPSALLPFERTTPAGRFESEPGRNHTGEAIVWFDYDAALAIHRLRPGKSQVGRLRRLASLSAADRRASLGCVVVPVAFYETVIAPTLGRERGVVYVLPETRSALELFGARREREKPTS